MVSFIAAPVAAIFGVVLGYLNDIKFHKRPFFSTDQDMFRLLAWGIISYAVSIFFAPIFGAAFSKGLRGLTLKWMLVVVAAVAGLMKVLGFFWR